MLKELEIQGVENYVFWEGFIDHEKPSRGIAKAHQQIVAWAHDLGLSDVLIAEDDIQFTAEAALECFLNTEPFDYDLYLGGISYGRIKDDNSVDDFEFPHPGHIPAENLWTRTKKDSPPTTRTCLRPLIH